MGILVLYYPLIQPPNLYCIYVLRSCFLNVQSAYLLFMVCTIHITPHPTQCFIKISQNIRTRK